MNAVCSDECSPDECRLKSGEMIVVQRNECVDERVSGSNHLLHIHRLDHSTTITRTYQSVVECRGGRHDGIRQDGRNTVVYGIPSTGRWSTGSRNGLRESMSCFSAAFLLLHHCHRYPLLVTIVILVVACNSSFSRRSFLYFSLFRNVVMSSDLWTDGPTDQPINGRRDKVVP